MNKAVLRGIFVLLVLVMTIGVGLWILWRDTETALTRQLPIKSAEIFELAEGTPTALVAKALVERGWLDHALYLRIELEMNGLGSRLQAGAYEILPGESLRELLDKMSRGRVKRYSLTIPEGVTVEALRGTLRQIPGLKVALADVPTEKLMLELGLGDGSPEGQFFPSTYFYKHQTTDRELLVRMNRKLRQVLTEAWANRIGDLPYTSPDEALVMASIIERETAAPAERAQIAGVFVRRLKQGMKLQTDPTVIYGMGAAFDGNLRRADLERDTPFNTYTRPGLPPTPICLPGKEAILAALAPAEGRALYFVARGDGRHVFSDSLTEHNAAVRTFQLGKTPSP